MAQHKQGKLKTLQSALKHKEAARVWLEEIDRMKTAIAAVQAKVDADADGTWDTDYESTLGTPLFDADKILVGQYRQPLRLKLISAMAHDKLGNTICDSLEEASVSLNALLAQMDADAGTLSDDATYEAYRIADLLEATERLMGPHKATVGRTMEVAISHKEFAAEILADMKSIQDGINALIDSIQAANA